MTPGSPEQAPVFEERLDRYRLWHGLAKRYFEWQYRQFAPFLGRRVADVGCGVGNLTPFLTDRELYIGVDVDPELLREQFREFGGVGNVELVSGDITTPECREALRQWRPDSILCVNLIEHIEDDARAIANMVDVLPRGGTLCLLVPAMPWLYGTLDALDGHHRRYTKRTLRERLARFPVDLLGLYYFNIVGALGWFLKGRILRETHQRDENYRVMSLLVPVLSWVEGTWHPPFGMSLIAVARRR